jgi:hypothetical protein
MVDSDDEDTGASKDPSMPPLEPKKKVGRIRGVNTTASKRNLMQLKLVGDKAYKEKQQRLLEQQLLAKASSNAATDDEDEEEEEEEEEAPVEKPKAKGCRPKGSKNKKGTVEKTTTAPKRNVFLDGNDYCLAKAWINCSETAVTGAGQKQQVFWQAISKKYAEIVKDGDYPIIHKVNVPDWGPKPLKQHFQKNIQPQVMKFGAAYHRITELNESGKTEEDHINDALAEYKLTSEGNKDFKFLHLCKGLLWEVSKFQPKSRTAQVDDDGSNAPYGDLDGNEDNDRSSVNRVSDSMQGATLKRPMGSKAAKRVLAEAHSKDYCHKQKMKICKEMS